MKEKQVIQRLQLLQSIQPDTQTFRLIQKRISSQIFPEKHLVLSKSLTVSRLAPLVAFTAAVLFILVVSGFLPLIVGNAVISTKIAFAPNQYEKAKIAFADVNKQFYFLKQNSFVSSNVNSLSKSLALANGEMAELKLMGEKGKYTKEQCLSLYSAYHSSLETMKKEVSLKFNSYYEKPPLLAEIKQYDEQSEKKLHNYKE